MRNKQVIPVFRLYKLKNFTPLIYITAVLLFSISSASLTAQMQFSVLPPNVSFNLKPGETASVPIRVENNAATAQSIAVSVHDWERDSLGKHNYYDAGTLSSSCSNWISVTPDFFELKSKESIDLNVTIQAPLDEKEFESMKWSMIFVKGIIEQTKPLITEGEMAMAINTTHIFGVHVYQTPPKIANDKEMKALQLELNPENESFEFIVENTGSTQFKGCKAYLEASNLESGKTYKLGPIPFAVFPKSVRKIVFETQKEDLPKGEYSVLAVLDYGKEFPLEAVEKTVVIE